MQTRANRNKRFNFEKSNKKIATRICFQFFFPSTFRPARKWFIGCNKTSSGAQTRKPPPTRPACAFRIKLKRPERKRCSTRTSRSAATHSWSCRNGPIDGCATRPESNGTCRQRPCGCAPNAFGWRRPSWSGSTDPRADPASDRRSSWCAGFCCRWRNAPGRLHGNHAARSLKMGRETSH